MDPILSAKLVLGSGYMRPLVTGKLLFTILRLKVPIEHKARGCECS